VVLPPKKEQVQKQIIDIIHNQSSHIQTLKMANLSNAGRQQGTFF